MHAVNAIRGLGAHFRTRQRQSASSTTRAFAVAANSPQLVDALLAAACFRCDGETTQSMAYAAASLRARAGWALLVTTSGYVKFIATGEGDPNVNRHACDSTSFLCRLFDAFVGASATDKVTFSDGGQLGHATERRRHANSFEFHGRPRARTSSHGQSRGRLRSHDHEQSSPGRSNDTTDAADASTGSGAKNPERRKSDTAHPGGSSAVAPLAALLREVAMPLTSHLCEFLVGSGARDDKFSAIFINSKI